LKLIAFVLFMAALILATALFTGALFVVPETRFSVITTLGAVDSTQNTLPGIRWRWPIVQKVHFFPAKNQVIDSEPEQIVTGDQKKLLVDHYVVWRIQNPVVFRNRLEHIERAESHINRIAYTALKEVLSQNDLRNIISEVRSELGTKARVRAAQEAQTLGVEIIDLRIKQVEFPQSNMERAFDRMKAERLKEAEFHRSQGKEQALMIRAQTDNEVALILARAKEDAAMIRAQAETQASEVFTEAYASNPEFYSFHRRLQSLRKTLDSNTTLILSPDYEAFKLLKNSN
jgi:modulator of FtsH protease HflC